MTSNLCPQPAASRQSALLSTWATPIHSLGRPLMGLGSRLWIGVTSTRSPAGLASCRLQPTVFC